MSSKNKAPKQFQEQRLKQKTRMTFILVSSVSALALIVAIFIYLNISGTRSSKAEGAESALTGPLPVELNQPNVLKKDGDMKLNGMRYKVPRQIPAGQKTVLN